MPAILCNWRPQQLLRGLARCGLATDPTGARDEGVGLHPSLGRVGASPLRGVRGGGG